MFFCIYLRTNSDLCHLQLNWLVFITEMKSVYSAVLTGSLNKAVCTSPFMGKIDLVCKDQFLINESPWMPLRYFRFLYLIDLILMYHVLWYVAKYFSVFEADRLVQKCGHLLSNAKCLGLNRWYGIEKELILIPHIKFTLSFFSQLYRASDTVKSFCLSSCSTIRFL